MAYNENEKSKIVNAICKEISEGKTLRSQIKKNKISSSTFFNWIDADENKSKHYARALELRAELMAEELINISDSTKDDIIIDDDGKKVVNHNVIQRDRLRVDTRKWLMSKMMPKKYGDFSKLTLDGGDKPIKIDFTD